MKCFYVYGIALASLLSPRVISLHSRAQIFVNASVNTLHYANKNFENTLICLHPMTLLVDKENNGSYTFGKILKHKDADYFIHVMIKEADDHENCNHREVVYRWDKPPGVKMNLAIWAFRRKCFPYGRIYKYKAQLCAHGGMQKYGVNYW